MASQQVWSSATPASTSDVTSLAQELNGIAERATNFTKASGTAVFLVHGDHLVVAAATNAVIAAGERIPIAGSFAGRAVQSGRVVRCDDAESDAGVNVRPFLPLRVRSLTAVPIGGVGRPVVGALVVVSDTTNTFNRTHMAILQTMADVVAEKCKTEDAFSAVLLAETMPRRSPLLDAHQVAAAPSVERPAAPLPSPTAIREVPMVLSGDPVPLAVRPAAPERVPLAIRPVTVEKPSFTAPAKIPAAVPRRVEHIPTAYDRPRVTASRSLNFKPLVAIAVAAVVILGGWWAIRQRFAATPVVSAAAAQPIATATAPTPAKEPAAAAAPAPLLPSKVEPQPERVAEERVTAKAARTEEPTQPVAIEDAPAPTLHLPSSSAMHDDSYVPAPKVALMAKTAAAPELLKPAAALPQAPVSKLVPAHLSYRVSPQYPLLQRRFGKEGKVNLRLQVGARGDVEQVEMISGDEGFRSAAVAAVKQWRYEPAVLNGKAVASSVEVELRFSLPKK